MFTDDEEVHKAHNNKKKTEFDKKDWIFVNILMWLACSSAESVLNVLPTKLGTQNISKSDVEESLTQW